MSYSFRNRPKLSDRYRGKSGDEILNELKNQIDEDRKMFFESSPGWNSEQSPGSFSRAGHPLDDMMSRGRQDIRSHLDDLAQRHPEFADHLRCPPWGGEMGATSRGTWGRKRRGSGSSGDDSTAQEPSFQDPQLSEEQSPRGRSRQNNLPQYGLRNTVDLGQQQQQQQQCEDQEKGRGQRSWSAPPDNRTQNPPDPPRFVSRLDIPINSTPSNVNPDQGKPPVAPKQHHNVQQPHQQHQPQQNTNSKQNQQGSTVRHIPIFVEGRDEPLLPKAADTSTEKIFTERVPPQTNFNYGRPSQFMSRPGQQQSAPQQTAFTQNATPSKAKTFANQQQVPTHHQPPQPSQHKQECSPQQDQCQPVPPPQQPRQAAANDPISRVQTIQNDVDELKIKVDNFKGNSRKDKDYMYFDEMLTRNLLKLDDIETEGKDDVRQARKAVIRNIQQCISNLESKVPNPDEISQNKAGVLEKLNESCDESVPMSSAGQDVTATERNANASSNEEEKVIQDNGELKMDTENPSSNDATQMNLKQESSKVQPYIMMDTESEGNSGATNMEHTASKMGRNVEKGTVTEGSEISSSNPVQEEQNLGSEKIKHSQNESVLQAVKMQVGANSVNNETSKDRMEIDNSNSKETSVPVSNDENDVKLTNQLPKGDAGDTVLNKTSNKTKSPKGSPKKGKRAT